MTSRQSRPASAGVLPPLKAAFHSLPAIIRDERSSWSSGELVALFKLAAATTGLETCVKKFEGLPGFPANDVRVVPGSLDAVWLQIHQGWAETREYEVSEQDWRWLLCNVLASAFAYPDQRQRESFQAGEAFQGYIAVASLARELHAMLAYVPEESVPGYSGEVDAFIDKGLCDDLDDLASACERAAGQQETDGGVNPQLPDTRTNHTGFFLSVAVNLKQYEFGESPPLKASHLVAIAGVLIPGVAELVEREGKDSLRREAERFLKSHGPVEDTSD